MSRSHGQHTLLLLIPSLIVSDRRRASALGGQSPFNGVLLVLSLFGSISGSVQHLPLLFGGIHHFTSHATRQWPSIRPPASRFGQQNCLAARLGSSFLPDFIIIQRLSKVQTLEFHLGN